MRRKRWLTGKAKAALCWCLVSFVVMQIAVRVCLDRFRPDLRNPTFEIKASQFAAHLERLGPRPTTVITLGSSTTINGLKAGDLEASLSAEIGRPALVYNMGVYGGGPFSQLMYARRLLSRGIRPDLVIVELLPMHLNTMPQPLDYERHPAYVLEKNDVSTVARYGSNPGVRREWWQAYLLPIYGHRLTILNGLAPVLVPFADRMETWKNVDEHGWSRLRCPNPDERRLGLEKIKNFYGPTLSKFKLGGPGLRALDELLTLLKKENVPAIMVLMPEGPFMQGLYDAKEWDKTIKTCQALGNKHGVRLFNARDWFGEDAFAESFHLHEHGAQLFTERLGRELIAPTLKQRQTAQAK